MECNTLIFLHMFKTGGSTLAQRIRNRVGDNRIGKFNVDPKHPEFYLNMEHICAVTGHNLWGVHANITQPYEYVTVFREPWDRFQSAYFNIRETVANGLSEHYNRYSIEEILTNDPEDFFTLMQTDNYYVRQLTGNVELPEITMGGEDLKLALKNLSFIKHIGLLSRLDEFWQALCKDRGWCTFLEGNEVWNNKGLARESVSEDVHRIFIEKNSLDYELFERVKQCAY